MVPKRILSTRWVWAATGLLAAATLSAQGPADAPDSAAKLAQLYEQREATLRQLVAALEKRHAVGQSTQEAVVRASNQLLEAQLERSTTNEERIALHESIVGNLRQLEAVAEAEHRASRGGVENYLQAKAARLKAEIRLWRTRANGS